MRTSYSVLTQTQTVQYSLLHTYAIWYRLLLLGYKPVQRVTVLNTVGDNCNTVLSVIILWDHRRICAPSLTETSLMRRIPVNSPPFIIRKVRCRVHNSCRCDRESRPITWHFSMSVSQNSSLDR